MNILLVSEALYPVKLYGGTERVIYSLAKALSDLGHNVSILCKKGSSCPFAEVIDINPEVPYEMQVPDKIDIVHFNNYVPNPNWDRPYIVTYHGNGINQENIVPNSVFVSKNHAKRHGCSSFVYNGLDWDDYPKPELTKKRRGFHFLGNAAWRVKNVQGAIDVVKKIKGSTLEVLGGHRLNLKMGFRFTVNPRIHFHGMVENEAKKLYIEKSEGLVFPVTWEEPFGLCVIESLFYGSPVFATPYGSLPELIHPELGRLTNSSDEMRSYLLSADEFDPNRCHQYAWDLFNANVMAKEYLKCYEKVLNGGKLITDLTPIDATDFRHKPWK